MEQGVRWLQRFEQLKKAFNNLRNAVELNKKRELSKLEEQGLIKAF